MKVITVITLLSLITSCSLAPVEQNKNNPENNPEYNTEKRVNVIEDSYYDIIEVDGCEYVSRYQGGIAHLANCKNHKLQQ